MSNKADELTKGAKMGQLEASVTGVKAGGVVDSCVAPDVGTCIGSAISEVGGASLGTDMGKQTPSMTESSTENNNHRGTAGCGVYFGLNSFGFDFPKKSSTAMKIRDYAIGKYFMRLDTPHKNVPYPHINFNVKVMGYDTHTKISEATVQVSVFGAKLLQKMNVCAFYGAIIYDCYAIYERTTNGEDIRELVGEKIGQWSGAFIGAKAGATVGSCIIPVYGTAVGSVAGGVGGALFLSFSGKWVGGHIGKWMEQHDIKHIGQADKWIGEQAGKTVKILSKL